MVKNFEKEAGRRYKDIFGDRKVILPKPRDAEGKEKKRAELEEGEIVEDYLPCDKNMVGEADIIAKLVHDEEKERASQTQTNEAGADARVLVLEVKTAMRKVQENRLKFVLGELRKKKLDGHLPPVEVSDYSVMSMSERSSERFNDFKSAAELWEEKRHVSKNILLDRPYSQRSWFYDLLEHPNKEDLVCAGLAVVEFLILACVFKEYIQSDHLFEMCPEGIFFLEESRLKNWTLEIQLKNLEDRIGFETANLWIMNDENLLERALNFIAKVTYERPRLDNIRRLMGIRDPNISDLYVLKGATKRLSLVDSILSHGVLYPSSDTFPC